MYVWRALSVAGILLLATVFAQAAQPRLLVCFGDSITAGYGLEHGQAYSDQLQRDLDAAKVPVRVVNRGTSGTTTRDALSTLPSILALHPDVVIVEFGGNDGLRGLPLEFTRRNLDQILIQLEAAHVRVLLAGITLPPNYGPEYIAGFEKTYRELAARHHTAFVPMLYKDLVHTPGTIQADGIHPTAKGSVLIARTLMPQLKPLLVAR